LYSKGQSNNTTRGFFTTLRISQLTASLFNTTPSITSLSSTSPPGIFSILTKRLVSNYAYGSYSLHLATIYTAFNAILHIKSPKRFEKVVFTAFSNIFIVVA